MIQEIDCEQGTPEWAAARCGIPTASMFASILAKGEGKMRKSYLMRLAGEVLTGDPAETFTNGHMDRGREMEAEARAAYQFQMDNELRRVGFIRNDLAGCSPDSLIDPSGGLEIKTALASIQVERLLKGELPSEHRAQVQGNLWVTGRDFWHFVSYCPKLPVLIVTVNRDEDYIKMLANEVARFSAELAQIVERVRRYGQRAAA